MVQTLTDTALPNGAKSAPSQDSPISAGATGSVLVLLQAEALIEMALAVAVYRHLGGTWLMFAILFVVPDVSMAGYLANPRIGAALYNPGHTYIAPALLAVAGFLTATPLLYLVALIWTAHIGFDRMIGAGFKYATGFSATHLRWKAPSTSKA